MGRMNLSRLPQVAALSSENKNDKLSLQWNEGRRQVNYAFALHPRASNHILKSRGGMGY